MINSYLVVTNKYKKNCVPIRDSYYNGYKVTRDEKMYKKLTFWAIVIFITRNSFPYSNSYFIQLTNCNINLDNYFWRKRARRDCYCQQPSCAWNITKVQARNFKLHYDLMLFVNSCICDFMMKFEKFKIFQWFY